MNDVITIVGTGMWGTTLAVQLAKANRPVRWLARTDGEAAQLRQWGENRRFLPGIPIPSGVHITSDPREAIKESALILLVVPSEAMRRNIRWIASYVSVDHKLVSATKGLDIGGGQDDVCAHRGRVTYSCARTRAGALRPQPCPRDRRRSARCRGACRRRCRPNTTGAGALDAPALSHLHEHRRTWRRTGRSPQECHGDCGRHLRWLAPRRQRKGGVADTGRC